MRCGRTEGACNRLHTPVSRDVSSSFRCSVHCQALLWIVPSHCNHAWSQRHDSSDTCARRLCLCCGTGAISREDAAVVCVKALSAKPSSALEFDVVGSGPLSAPTAWGDVFSNLAEMAGRK